MKLEQKREISPARNTEGVSPLAESVRQPGIAGLDGSIVNIPRYIGIDLGAETAKVVELVRDDNGLRIGRRRLVEHREHPGDTIVKLLRELDWDGVAAAAATGRASRMLGIERVPTKVALARGVRYAFPQQGPLTLVSIGAQGFSVLELRDRDTQAYRENARCSQGTGNFLRQLVKRFDLTIAEADAVCADVKQPAALSGRCPVILKTDMTHLANKGESRAAILAGLYDAVCENVQVLINPRRAPPRVLLTGGVPQAAPCQAQFSGLFGKKSHAAGRGGCGRMSLPRGPGCCTGRHRAWEAGARHRQPVPVGQ